MRATDRQRLEDSADGLHRLVRRARSRLFFSVITLVLVVVLANATPPDAATFGIYNAEDGDDVCLDEALPPRSTPPLRATDARTPHLGDSWSARVARTLMTVRERAPPGATGRITIPAPPSVPVFSMCLPAVTTDPVVAFFHQVAASIQKLGDGLT